MIIKYRVWVPFDTERNPGAGRMLQVDEIGNMRMEEVDTLSIIVHDHILDEKWLIKPQIHGKPILMQSSGLTDKNGKDIYTADIVRVGAHYAGDNKVKDCIGIIEWKAPEFYVLVNEDYISLWDAVHSHGIEVIGNIFEHPELMEKPKCV